MLSMEENAQLTQVSRGTPMGELLRRYWQPVATVPDLEREETLKLRIMGEDLVLYLTTRGQMGLVQARCPHRSASLAYGIPDEDGIRCAYHGWYFNTEGACLAQPYDEAENPASSFKERVKITAYPVQVMGGLVWAYMGPSPAPVLPRFEFFAREDLHHTIRITKLPCNWLQAMENSMDPAHFEWLHAHRMNYTARKRGLAPVMRTGRTIMTAYDVFEYGIYKRRIIEGDPPEESPDWLVGHPTLFPNTVVNGKSFQIRVPIDDDNTLHIAYNSRIAEPGEKPSLTITPLSWDDGNGDFVLDTILGTDMMAWITQGAIAPRDKEHLGLVDKGIILYRQLLFDNMAKVQRGEDPMAVIRDAARDEIIHLKTEEDLGGGWRGFAPLNGGPERLAPQPIPASGRSAV